MGYTHYWDQENVLIDDDRWLIAIAKCNTIVKANAGILGDGNGEGNVKLAAEELWFNGKGAYAHETFFVGRLESGGFCKTDHKAYDPVVVGCLAVLAHELRGHFTVSSDGGPAEWQPGVELACNVLGENIPNPIEGA
jgi:hypothetical protein